MKTIFVFLLLTSTAFATPCDDARKDFERARKFGATEFKCQDRYDGTATSSWTMSSENYKKFRESEANRRMRKK